MSINLSMNSLDTEVLASQLSNRSKSTAAVETTFCVVLNILALFLNTILCWAVYNNERLRRITNIYVLALAATDLLMAILVMPFLCDVSVNGGWTLNWFACQFQGYWCAVLAYTAQLLFPLAAINRYTRVLHLKIYATIFNDKKYILLSIVVVTLCALTAPLPYLLRGHEFAFHPGMMICFYTIANTREKQALYRIIFFTVLPMVVVTFCYIRIYRTVKRHTKRLQNNMETSAAANATNKLSSDEIVITKTLFAIVLGFFVCWTPLYTITSIDTAFEGYRLPRQIYFLATYFVGLSSIANPIIFGCMNASFREECKNLIGALRQEHTDRVRNI
ncbi:melatonin receptor type 1A-like [Stylophora pistillata]|uniref:melatonin receptor type 1A-like n=1 Tax=Stylophora pistillata TaxID=50429 RepID=UPI000C04A31F|nr:melatonin receptor type 1A-like [Stylophora pistillata]